MVLHLAEIKAVSRAFEPSDGSGAGSTADPEDEVEGDRQMAGTLRYGQLLRGLDQRPTRPQEKQVLVLMATSGSENKAAHAIGFCSTSVMRTHATCPWPLNEMEVSVVKRWCCQPD